MICRTGRRPPRTPTGPPRGTRPCPVRRRGPGGLRPASRPASAADALPPVSLPHGFLVALLGERRTLVDEDDWHRDLLLVDLRAAAPMRPARHSDDDLDAMAPAVAETSGDSLRLGPGVPRPGRQSRAELGTRTDAELLVDAGEVRLDGLRADERRFRDLPIRHPGRRQLGDPALALGQLIRGSMTEAEPGDLVPRALRPRRRAQLLEDRERLGQRVSRRQLPIGATLELALGRAAGARPRTAATGSRAPPRRSPGLPPACLRRRGPALGRAGDRHRSTIVAASAPATPGARARGAPRRACRARPAPRRDPARCGRPGSRSSRRPGPPPASPSTPDRPPRSRRRRTRRRPAPSGRPSARTTSSRSTPSRMPSRVCRARSILPRCASITDRSANDAMNGPRSVELGEGVARVLERLLGLRPVAGAELRHREELDDLGRSDRRRRDRGTARRAGGSARASPRDRRSSGTRATDTSDAGPVEPASSARASSSSAVIARRARARPRR